MSRAATLHPVAQKLDTAVVRYFADDAAVAAAEPSYALLSELHRPASPADLGVQPVFSTVAGQSVATISVPAGTSLYGTGMVAGPLLRNGQTITTWNADVPGYGVGSQNLYQSHPWVLALRADGSAFGVLADTTRRCTIATLAGIVFTCPAGFPVIVIERSSPQAVVEELAKLTGHMMLPPKWTLGYQQSKYGYSPASKVWQIATQLRSNQIPSDAIWVDIDYMDSYRIFSFDKTRFPDPSGLTRKLQSVGLHSVWMIDPAVKQETGPGITAIYDSGNARDVWVKQADGSAYVGNVWAGPSVFPDFTNPGVRSWWATFFKSYLANGISGVWNDMDEPAVFDAATERTMPLTNRHAGDSTLLDDDMQAQGALRAASDHNRYHNVYGMMMARATHDAMLATEPNRRPFVLSRANYIGGQRYAAAWTGDNTASWQHLALSISMILNVGLSGQPFVGADIGGFLYPGSYPMPGTPNFTESHARDELLYARWIGIGAMQPFSRGHYVKEYPWPKEPYAWSAATTRTSRLAIQRRYRLMPYLYSLFEDSSQTGLPVMRPLFFSDPKDPKLRAIDNEFLLGDDLLVSAQVIQNQTAPVVLPAGIWRQVAFPETNAPGAQSDAWDADLPKLYLRGGSIVPAGPIEQFVDQKPLTDITLLVCLDAAGSASGTLYEDAGDGFDYLPYRFANGKGTSQFLRTTFKAWTSGNRVFVAVADRTGKLPHVLRNLHVRLFTANGERSGSGLDNAKVAIAMSAASAR